MNSNLIGLIIGFLLTLFIYSYIWGDNPLYRLAVHILVGVSAGYAAVVVVRELLLPVYVQLRANPTTLELAGGLVPFVLGLLLVLKRLPRLAWLGTGTIALLVGVGAAVALMGALTGTLLPQVTAVADPDPMIALLAAVPRAISVTGRTTTFMNDEPARSESNTARSSGSGRFSSLSLSPLMVLSAWVSSSTSQRLRSSLKNFRSFSFMP